MKTLLALLRYRLRRHRAVFLVPLVLLVAHETLLLWVYGFWRRQLRLSDWLVGLIPEPLREGAGIPLGDLTHPHTYQALVWLRPDFRALTLFFFLSVATDAVAGEIGRGTSDLLFAHPIRRAHAVAAAALAMLLHALCLAGTLIVAFLVATAIFPMGAHQPAWTSLVPAALDVAGASLVIGLCALALSCACASRARAVAASVAFAVVPILLEFAGVFSEPLRRTLAVLPEHYYVPHVLLAGAPDAFGAGDALALAGIAAVALAGAFAVTARRDLAG